MKKAIGLILGLVLATTLFADDAMSISFSSGVWSKDLDTDGYVYDDGVVSKSELVVSAANGFYVGAEHAVGKNVYARRLDVFAGYYREGAIDIDVGYSYESYHRILRGGTKNNLFTLYAKLSKEFASEDSHWSFAPFLELEHYKMGKESDFEGGFRGRFGAGFGRQILGSRLVGETAVVRDDGSFGLPSTWTFVQTLGLDWEVGKATLRIPEIAYYAPKVDEDELRQRTFVLGAKVSFEF